jgi:hypothetical protein
MSRADATRSPVEDASPFARHRAGVREAKRALNARLQGEGGAAPSLGAEEWAAWARCRQLGVPLAAAPGSAAIAALAFAVATAVGRAQTAAARAVLDSRASLAATAGLLVFNYQTGSSSALSERCYVHALAGNSEAGASMRAAYRAAAGDNAFIAAAEGVARAQNGQFLRAAAAGDAAPATAPARYPRTDFADRLQAVMQFAPAPEPTRGPAAARPRPSATASPALAMPADEGASFGLDEQQAQSPRAPPPPQEQLQRRRPGAARAAEATPRWSAIAFGDEDDALQADAAAASAAASAAAAAAAAARDPEPSWAARARRREQLFEGGRGGGGGGGDMAARRVA